MHSGSVLSTRIGALSEWPLGGGQSLCVFLDQAVDTATTEADVVGVLENVDLADLSDTTIPNQVFRHCPSGGTFRCTAGSIASNQACWPVRISR
jgi:hypothetical protein